MKKITVIGDFAYGYPVYSGQTAKTRDIYNSLSEKYEKVQSLDTRNWKKHIVGRTLKFIALLFTTKCFVLPLCRNGRKSILLGLLILKPVFKYKIIFPAVGGSLMEDYKNEKQLMKRFNRIDGVFFETKQMVDFFKKMGYSNIHYLPVFSTRSLTISKFYNTQPPFKFCTYSRVIKEKGISNAINAISNVNKKAGKIVCTLDIFGNPSIDYKDEFDSLLSTNYDCVFSKNLLGDNAVDVLSSYYALLFPTYYEGEGFPIALIECMKAGLPCICSDWHFNSEIISDGVTGYVFDLNENDALEKCIIDSIENPEKIKIMSKNCIEEVKKYEPSSLLREMFELVDGRD